MAHLLEVSMDADKDDKSFVEKTVEVVKNIAANISEAAHKTAEPEPVKSDDEVVMMPMATAGLVSETAVPPFVVIRKPPKKVRAKSAKTVENKAARRAPRKVAKKSKVKSRTGGKAVAKETKKPTPKKKTRKSSR
jgi:hypothetical protein